MTSPRSGQCRAKLEECQALAETARELSMEIGPMSWSVSAPPGLHAEGGGVTLKEIETRLRREPELDKLEPEVVEVLARAVMRFVQAGEAAD